MIEKDSNESELGDNLHLDVRGSTFETFKKAMEIAYSFSIGSVATHYRVDNKEGIILFCCRMGGGMSMSSMSSATTNRPDIIEFPFEMDLESMTDFIWHWLNYKHRNDYAYPNKIDHDGSDKPGFRIRAGNYSDDKGWDWMERGAFMIIRPELIWLGK